MSRLSVRRAPSVRVLLGLVLGAGTLTTAAACGRSPSPTTSPTTLPASTTTASITTTTSTTPTVPTTPPAQPTTVPSTTIPSTTAPTANRTAPATVVWKGRTDRRMVALTFDAGSDAGYTSRILAELATTGIRATFGITGLWAQANPDLVRQIAAAGDQIVNHTWDHRSFTGASTGTTPLTSAQIAEELSRTDDLIRRLTGAGTGGWFRPPYGDRSAGVDSVAGAAGYRWELMWTVDTLGWKGVAPATVVQRALAALTPGEIILMHVGSASTDAAALPSLIQAIRAAGYGFTTAANLG